MQSIDNREDITNILQNILMKLLTQLEKYSS